MADEWRVELAKTAGGFVGARRVVVFLLGGLALVGLIGLGTELHVPRGFPTIQAAVDAARPGDVVVLAPGRYEEAVVVEQKKDLVICGDVELAFSEDVACWDTVSHPVLAIVLVGSIHILSSNQIVLERLTITGPGPGIRIEGTQEYPSTDISIRYCNLLSNAGGTVALGDHYKRVAVMCSNARLGEGQSQILKTDAIPHREDVLLTCNFFSFGSPERRPYLRNAPEVIVAVIDSGIDRMVPALSCRIWRNPGEIPGNGIDDDANGYVDDLHGWDFRDEDAESLVGSPLYWHGTFVAGLIVDAVESSSTIGERAPSVEIMDLRFLDSKGFFCTSDWPKLARAIDYAVDNGARIINLSLYVIKEPPAYVRKAVQRAMRHGALVVAIAGNDSAELGPIANWPELLTVSAVDEKRQPASFSNAGEEVDIAAPGVNVLSVMPGGATAVRSGTSFAAPCVAGLAALHLSEHPNLSPDEIREWLEGSAVDVGAPGRDPRTGWGFVE